MYTANNTRGDVSRAWSLIAFLTYTFVRNNVFLSFFAYKISGKYDLYEISTGKNGIPCRPYWLVTQCNRIKTRYYVYVLDHGDLIPRAHILEKKKNRLPSPHRTGGEKMFR